MVVHVFLRKIKIPRFKKGWNQGTIQHTVKNLLSKDPWMTIKYSSAVYSSLIRSWVSEDIFFSVKNCVQPIHSNIVFPLTLSYRAISIHPCVMYQYLYFRHCLGRYHRLCCPCFFRNFHNQIKNCQKCQKSWIRSHLTKFDKSPEIKLFAWQITKKVEISS